MFILSLAGQLRALKLLKTKKGGKHRERQRMRRQVGVGASFVDGERCSWLFCVERHQKE